MKLCIMYRYIRHTLKSDNYYDVSRSKKWGRISNYIKLKKEDIFYNLCVGELNKINNKYTYIGSIIKDLVWFSDLSKDSIFNIIEEKNEDWREKQKDLPSS